MSHSGVPKAVLYYDPLSVWSRAALLTLEEKGYSQDEVDFRMVDMTKAEEFSPALLRLNPKVTLPILVVPLQGTLGPDVETRFKVIADPKELLDFLDRSRSTTSRSHSTSTAPSPSLSPTTVGFLVTSNKVIDIVHSDAVVPETLLHFNSRDPRSLQNLAATLVPVLQNKKEVLATHIADCEREVIKMSDRTMALWNNTKHEMERLLKYFSGEQAEEYFKLAKQTWEREVPNALVKVNEEIVGPYILGDQISIADIHLCAWLVDVVSLSGGNCSDSGDVALSKVEQHTGLTFPKDGNLQCRLAVFWDFMKRRSSWVNVFLR